MLVDVSAIPFPLSGPDDMWVALSPNLSLREAREELVEFLRPWIEDQIYLDDNGKETGWITPMRKIVENIYMGAIRPDDEIENWWWECKQGEGVPAWIFKS